MKRLLSEQVGKVLLVLALVWVGVSAALCPEHRASFDKETEVKQYQRNVQVQFNPQELAPREAVFPDRAEYRGTERLVWSAPEKKEDPFRGLDLPPVTRAAVAPPPQLLTAPGPSLQGAEKLPRWGQELPPIAVPQPDPKKAGGAGPADPAKKADLDVTKKPGPDPTKAAPPLDPTKKAPAEPAKKADTDTPKKAGASPGKREGDTKKAGEEILQ